MLFCHNRPIESRTEWMKKNSQEYLCLNLTEYLYKSNWLINLTGMFNFMAKTFSLSISFHFDVKNFRLKCKTLVGQLVNELSFVHEFIAPRASTLLLFVVVTCLCLHPFAVLFFSESIQRTVQKTNKKKKEHNFNFELIYILISNTSQLKQFKCEHIKYI